MRLGWLFWLAWALAGCSFQVENVVPDRRPDYRQSKIVDPLEVPPDLTASTLDDTLLVPELNPAASANLSDYQSERGADGRPVFSETVLRDQPNLRIEREGERRWLVVDRPAAQLWPRIKEFWTSNGLPLTREDPRIGIMETDWLENRADIPDGPVRAVLKRFIDFAYSAPSRDKFRVRLERTGENTTEIYLSHYGVEEVIQGAGGGKTLQQATTTSVWQARASDPELEAEMLNRLMVYLGASERRAETELAKGETVSNKTRMRLGRSSDGQRVLVIEEDYDRAWRLVGSALDSGNFAIEDQNRAEGLYVVEYRDQVKDSRKKGLLSALAFWQDEAPPAPGERYQVRLAGRGERTLVIVQDDQGRPDASETAQRILDNVRETLSG